MNRCFAVIAYDAPDGAEKRTTYRAEHFSHIERIIDRIAIAGPLQDESGGFIGSLVVVKADSAADAQTILESDPYFKAGVWERWEIHPFLAAAGEWVGGKTW